MKKSHVYQLGLRRADDEKKKFIIERDLIFRDIKITEKELQQISDKHKCDVQVVYLGVLAQPKNEETLEIKYHTKDMIQEKIDLWNYEKPQQEVSDNA